MITVYVMEANEIAENAESAVVTPRGVAISASKADDETDKVSPLTLDHGTQVSQIHFINGQMLHKNDQIRIEEVSSPRAIICWVQNLRAVEASKLSLSELNMLGYKSPTELQNQFAAFGEKLWFLQLHAVDDSARNAYSKVTHSVTLFQALLRWFRDLMRPHHGGLENLLETAAESCPISVSVESRHPEPSAYPIYCIQVVFRENSDGIAMIKLSRRPKVGTSLSLSHPRKTYRRRVKKSLDLRMSPI